MKQIIERWKRMKNYEQITASIAIAALILSLFQVVIDGYSGIVVDPQLERQRQQFNDKLVELQQKQEQIDESLIELQKKQKELLEEQKDLNEDIIQLDGKQTSFDKKIADIIEAKKTKDDLESVRLLIIQWEMHLTRYGNAGKLNDVKNIFAQAQISHLSHNYTDVQSLLEEITQIIPIEVLMESDPRLWPLQPSGIWSSTTQLDFWKKVDPESWKDIPIDFWMRKPIEYWKNEIPQAYWKYLPFKIQ